MSNAPVLHGPWLSIKAQAYDENQHSLSDNQRSNTSLTNQNKHPSLVITNRIYGLHSFPRISKGIPLNTSNSNHTVRDFM